MVEGEHAQSLESRNRVERIVRRSRVGDGLGVRRVQHRLGDQWVDHVAVPDAGDRDLWTAVAGLPERQRQALAYHYLGGLPHGETATLVGGSVESVRRAASDGIAALRRIYSTQERSTS